jgi:hypothetical protein
VSTVQALLSLGLGCQSTETVIQQSGNRRNITNELLKISAKGPKSEMNRSQLYVKMSLSISFCFTRLEKDVYKYGGKREVLFFYFVPATTRDLDEVV